MINRDYVRGIKEEAEDAGHVDKKLLEIGEATI